jgi:hypothetical protein
MRGERLEGAILRGYAPACGKGVFEQSGSSKVRREASSVDSPCHTAWRRLARPFSSTERRVNREMERDGRMLPRTAWIANGASGGSTLTSAFLCYASHTKGPEGHPAVARR